MIIRDLMECPQDTPDRLIDLVLDGFAGGGAEELTTREGAAALLAPLDEPDAIARIALDAAGAPFGLIGGLRCYQGHGYELHPLVVRPDSRGKGIGTALVADLEREASNRGAGFIWLGTDDHNGGTSIGGIDLYPDVLAKLAGMKNVGAHPFGFYVRVGFTVVGCLPDANGFGKPDIFMAKRIGR